MVKLPTATMLRRSSKQIFSNLRVTNAAVKRRLKIKNFACRFLTARSVSTTIEFAFSVMPSIKRFSQLRRLTENLTLLSEREIKLSRQ